MYIYKGHKIQDIVNNAEWQQLRSALVGTWMKQPSENVSTLRNYLNTDRDCTFRWLRVYNYLTGTAFRIGRISHPDIDNLLSEVKYMMLLVSVYFPNRINM
jgi:hypothetical protein